MDPFTFLPMSIQVQFVTYQACLTELLPLSRKQKKLTFAEAAPIASMTFAK